MATRDHTGRNVVLVGGAGLVAWWLLSRGEGWGFRARGNGKNVDGPTITPPRAEPCIVWIRADRLEVDGVVADLPTVIAGCRAVGTAVVHATGDAIMRVIRDVLTSLHAAGVKLYTPPDLTYLVPSSPVVP
jgi:hypothetical protein